MPGYNKMSTEEKEKIYQFLTSYRRDYIKRPDKRIQRFAGKQEYKDPLGEGFKNYLEIENPKVEPPSEDGDIYLDKVKDAREKIGRMYFETPLDHKSIKWYKLLDGKSSYQTDYCDIEGDANRKLADKLKKESQRLPDDWVIPLTTQKYDFRDPIVLSEHALDRPPRIKPVNNLVQNEKINEILHVTCGDSEYNAVIGQLGEFIVVQEMHGKIDK